MTKHKNGAVPPGCRQAPRRSRRRSTMLYSPLLPNTHLPKSVLRHQSHPRASFARPASYCRLNHRQPRQKFVQIHGFFPAPPPQRNLRVWQENATPATRQVSAPRYRKPPRESNARRRMVEYDRQLALIFPAEFPHLQRSRFCRRLPIHMPRRILRQILSNPIQNPTRVLAQNFPLPAHHSGNISNNLVRRLHRRIHQHLALQYHMPRLPSRNANRKPRRHSEADSQ